MALESDDTTLRVRVGDDGCGFIDRDVNRREGAGLGLFGMQERASLVGGTLTIASHPGGGTVVEVAVPLVRALAVTTVPEVEVSA